MVFLGAIILTLKYPKSDYMTGIKFSDILVKDFRRCRKMRYSLHLLLSNWYGKILLVPCQHAHRYVSQNNPAAPELGLPEEPRSDTHRKS